jgi:hypothetical protein
MKIVFKVEVQGLGIQPYEFATEKAANDYGIGLVSWSGRKWRVIKQRVRVASE